MIPFVMFAGSPQDVIAIIFTRAVTIFLPGLFDGISVIARGVLALGSGMFLVSSVLLQLASLDACFSKASNFHFATGNWVGQWYDKLEEVKKIFNGHLTVFFAATQTCCDGQLSIEENERFLPTLNVNS